MKTYKLLIQEYNIMENDYITREEIVKTNDIYHEIGKIYCQSLVKIKRIDYLEITKDLEQEIERLNNIIKRLEKYCNEEIEDYDKNIKSQYITDIAKEQYEGEKVCFEDMLYKIKELKGSDKE